MEVPVQKYDKDVGKELVTKHDKDVEKKMTN